MTVPRSGASKPGDDDSWESLAEDLFGIDFKRPDDGDLADDDFDLEDEVVSPVAGDQAVDLESDAEAGFPDDEEADEFSDDEPEGSEELEAGFPEDEEPEPVSRGRAAAPARRDSPRREASPEEGEFDVEARSGRKPAPKADEGDSFWDALNDWDWKDPAEKRQRITPEPVSEERAVRPDPEAGSEPEHESRGPRRRRRGRGGRGESVERPAAEDRPVREPTPERGGRPARGERSERGSDPVTRREPAATRRRSPEPVSDFEGFDEDVAGGPSGGQDEFGAGLLDSEPKRRQGRRPVEGVPSTRPERAERPEPASRRRLTESSLSESVPSEPSDESEDVADREETGERPRRRRRRRRRRSSGTSDAVSSSGEEMEAGFPEEEDEAGFTEEAGFPEEEEPAPPRRRRGTATEDAERVNRVERSVRGEQRHSNTAPPAAPTKSAKHVPTWAEAIALLVHRRPKQTTGWTPESEEEGERRPRRGPPRRRRRS